MKLNRKRRKEWFLTGGSWDPLTSTVSATVGLCIFPDKETSIGIRISVGYLPQTIPVKGYRGIGVIGVSPLTGLAILLQIQRDLRSAIMRGLCDPHRVMPPLVVA